MPSLPIHLMHVDHPDDERYDHITIEVEERWKESELSGDEWRFSYVIKAWRKQKVIVERSFSRLDWALQALGYVINIWPADGEHFDRVAWDSTKTLCDQPGCALPATIFYKRLKRYTKGGEELAPSEYHDGNEYRQFCDRHKNRGDCALDDAVHNYEQFEIKE